jgi:hypothetical protein
MTMNRTGVASDRRNIVILNLIQNLPGLPCSTPHTHGIKNYYVYMLTNRGSTLYTGVTGDLFRRVWQHRSGTGSECPS